MRNISSVIMKSCDTEIQASHEVATPAGIAFTTMSTVPAHTDALPSLPRRHTGSHLVHNAGYLVTCDPWVVQAWPIAFLHKQVTMTNPAGLHFNADLVCSGCRDLSIDDLECCTGRVKLNSGHVWHVSLLLT